jgi:integrase
MANRLEKLSRCPGIYRVHRRSCAQGADCKCRASYQATVSVFRDGKRKLVRRHFETVKAARQRREDAGSQVRAGKFAVPTRTTLYEAAVEFVEGMRAGRIFDRSGRPYKPSTIRGYDTHLRSYILPALGGRRLSSITRRDLQHLLERLQGEPLNLLASTIRNVLCPLQVVFGRAVHDEQLAVDPTVGLRLPAARGKRERIASPDEARALLAALPASDRALWATAFYAGLRRGELQALRWRCVDFEQRVIRVEKSWDQVAGEIDVKTDAGRRTVPMADALRRELAALKLASGRAGDDLVFGRTPAEAFVPSTVRLRAIDAWKAAELEPIGLHEARHCAASFLIAAGVNAKELSVYMGHSDIRVTYNVYGHLWPGGLSQAADRLSAFLDADQASG